MEFMLVCYNDEKHWESLPRPQQDRIVADCVAYAEDLRRRGQLRASGRLQSTVTAKTVREDGGKSLITDGPFAETK
ncbi:MAG: YciI family protein, partial [Opitutaceae bacterium]